MPSTESRGTRSPDRRRANMREVADRAGVAMSSVSRVMSGHPDVSPKMHDRVMRAVEDLGYVPDILAQGLRTQRTLSIGFSLSDISNPVLAQTALGAERRMRDSGYSMLLTNAEGDPSRDADHIRLLLRRRVDGLLLSLTDEGDPATRTALREATVPLVLIDRDRPAGIAASRVSFDHQAGMNAAATHLFELGHRHVALISGGPRRPSRQRRNGILQVFDQKGVNASCSVHEGGFDIEDGARATRAILDSKPRPTAIIAAGNQLMHGALRTLHEDGVRIGPELSFVGCDDVAVAEFHDPPISLVRRDARELGRVAADLLVSAVDSGNERDVDLVLPTEFIARASTVAPRRSR